MLIGGGGVGKKKKSDHIQFNDQKLNSGLLKIDIQLCST